MDPIRLYQALLEKHGLTTNSLAKAVFQGKEQAAKNLQSKLHKWEHRQTKEPAKRTLDPVAKFFHISLEALYDPEAARSEARRLGLLGDQLTVIKGSSRAAQERDREVEIREYNTGGSMGFGVTLKDQPGQIRSWRVTMEWVTKNVRSHTSMANLCVVTGFGDSMRPLFNPGDPLLIDAGVKSVDFDAIYFFRVGNEGFIKRLQRVPGEGLVALSENKAYRDWVIKPEMDFEVFGRVLRIWRGDDY